MPSCHAPEDQDGRLAAAAWASSGAMALSGRAGGPPVLAVGRPAGVVAAQLAQLDRHMGAVGHPCSSMPTVELLGERAAINRLRRRGPWSCGGSYRAFATRDGWWGISLGRPADIALVPALVEDDAAAEDPWRAIARWVSTRTSDEVAQRGRLLGLPAAAVADPGQAPRRAAVEILARASGRSGGRPRVVDFSALWAGPLCAHLLGLFGAEVIKVETWSRPDGARLGPRPFFDLLHGGHRMVAFDPSEPRDLRHVRALVDTADVVIEASRPRALERWGLDAVRQVATGTTWVSITAQGRSVDAVGFGDDIAAGAGLVEHEDGDVLPLGDAIGDPLTGVAAATAVADSLSAGEARLIDVSMHHVVAEAAVGSKPPHRVERRDGRWWLHLDGLVVPVRPPRARHTSGVASPSGADQWLLTS